MTFDADVIVIGAGAAGLFAALGAAGVVRRPNDAVVARTPRILVLDAGPRPGLKILVSGGGRCNLTNARVGVSDFETDAPHALRAILAEYPAVEARRWFESEGVATYEEPLGKVFPQTDDAKTVLRALLDACARSGIGILGNTCVETLDTDDPERVVIHAGDRTFTAGYVVVATGGKSLPKTGSRGAGYAFARSLGHEVIAQVPALVAIKTAPKSVIDGLSGVTLPARLDVSPPGTDPERRCGRKYAPTATACGSVLVTHDGLTGPAALDVSGAVGRARIEGNDVSVFADFWALVGPEGDWPMFTTSDKAPGACVPPDDAPPVTAFERFDADLLRIGGDKTLAGALAIRLPKALATRCVERSGVPLGKSWKSAAPAERRRVWIEVCHAEIRPVGDAGWDRAEVTSGGVPLADLDRRTLADRHAPRVRWCGETIHVTGRLGGFNFQWAWSSGFVAGRAVLLDYANASK